MSLIVTDSLLEQLTERCRRVAQDFTIGAEPHPRYGSVMRATCTIDGRAFELSTVIDESKPFATTQACMLRVLEGCIASLEHRWERLKHRSKP